MEEINKIILDFAIKVTELLRERFKDNLTSVCLFGSAVRKSLRKGSDIDFLLVMKETNPSYHKRVKEILPILDYIWVLEEFKQIEGLKLGLEPSFLILSTVEVKKHPPILIDIAEEGLILEDQNDFLKGELNQVKERLNTLGSIKKMTPQGHYWLLKPDIEVGEVIKI